MAETILTTVLCTILSAAAMFAITKMIGYRQMSEMTLFDYVNGITVGSMGAELATSKANEFLSPLIAIILFGVITVLLAVATSKSRRVRGFINGTPLILLKNGKMYRKNFTAAHLDLDEFLMQCRNQGYFDLSQVECAILETNGSLSILPRSSYRPATPADLNVSVSSASVPVPVILDGKVYKDALQKAGLDEVWLSRRLKELGYSGAEKVFFAFVSDGELYPFGNVT